MTKIEKDIKNVINLEQSSIIKNTSIGDYDRCIVLSVHGNNIGIISKVRKEAATKKIIAVSTAGYHTNLTKSRLNLIDERMKFFIKQGLMFCEIDNKKYSLYGRDYYLFMLNGCSSKEHVYVNEQYKGIAFDYTKSMDFVYEHSR